MVLWSNGSLSVSTSGYTTTKADTGRSSGKWFWELTGTRVDSSIVGISNESVPLTGTNFLNTGARWYYGNTGEKTPPRSTYAESYATGDVIGILLDLDNGILTYYKNGVSQGVAFTDVNTLGEVFPTVARGSSSGTHGWLANFGASEFSYLPNDLPSGTKSYDDSKALVSINKTLILHDGEYKKWNQGSPATPTIYSSNLIPTMTSNTAPSGVAFSSGIFSSTFDTWKAFDKSDSTEWANTNGIFNGWLGYKFTNPIKIKKYSIMGSSVGADSSPKNWTFEASNDSTNGTDGTWVTIDTQSNQINWTLKEVRSFEVNNTTNYLWYRINITSNNGNASYLKVTEIQMMEVINPSISATQPSWQTVSTTLPTVSQFFDNGMDSLAPLLDRKVMQLEPQMMDSKIGILPVGSTAKVFSKKIDLNKYMDTRKIEVK